jgi:hypothetical protein
LSALPDPEETVTPRLAPQKDEIEQRLQNVRWMVSYLPTTFNFTYLPKVLATEPRGNTSPSDTHYYTQSPTEFKTHMELVAAFEKALS